MEIVIADDGSAKNYREELKELFREVNFQDYQLIMNEKNQGTIANYLSGLTNARGKYVKGISPGDFLTGEHVLKDWLAFVRKVGFRWSFSNAIYYRNEKGQMVFLPTPAFPVYLKPYREGNLEKCRWNYAVLDDAALGATMIGERTLFERYARELLEIGNKYCEDYSFRMMMFDGIPGAYYEADTVFYEAGSGISSSGNATWQKRIQQEFLQMSQRLMQRKNLDTFQVRMMKQIRKKTSMKAMIRIPGKIRRAILFSRIRRKPLLNIEDTKKWREQCR